MDAPWPRAGAGISRFLI